MKRLLRPLALVVLGGCLFAGALAAFDHSRQIRLESRDGRYRAVQVRTDNYVHLERRLSDSPCRQGFSWGYDGNRIWVDNGCRAIFEYGSDRYGDGRYDPNYRDDRYDPNDRYGNNGQYDPQDRYGDGRVARIRVESDDFRRHFCRIAVRGEVRIVRRLSDAPCRIGYSWGYSSEGIWVDEGCRAEFAVQTR